MMAGMEVVIEAPPLKRRPWAQLLDEAYEIPIEGDKWRAGVTFSPMGCDGPHQGSELEFCIPDPDDDLDDDVESGDCPVFPAFHIAISETATTLDFDAAFVNGRLDERWAAMVSSSLTEHLIVGGAATGEPTLAGSAEVITGGGSATSVIGALAFIDSHLAATLHGAQGMVWCAPGVLPYLNSRCVRVGNTLHTPAGHIIVGDAGHSDQPPTGQSTSAPYEGWFYGTGMVGYKLGQPMFRDAAAVEYLDRTRNDIHARLVAEAVVVFDPCPVGAIKFGYNPSIDD